MALKTKSLCGFHSLPTPLGERRSRKEGVERVIKGKQGDRRVVGGGCHQNTTALLPNPPYSNITAQTSPARLRVGEVLGDKEKASIAKLKLCK